MKKKWKMTLTRPPNPQVWNFPHFFFTGSLIHLRTVLTDLSDAHGGGRAEGVLGQWQPSHLLHRQPQQPPGRPQTRRDCGRLLSTGEYSAWVVMVLWVCLQGEPPGSYQEPSSYQWRGWLHRAEAASLQTNWRHPHLLLKDSTHTSIYFYQTLRSCPAVRYGLQKLDRLLNSYCMYVSFRFTSQI